jgi:hypothetical protein
MKQRIVATFAEEFGIVEVFFEHKFFSLVSLDKVSIGITSNSGAKELLPGGLETINNFYHYQILKQIHAYQVERKIKAELIYAAGYKELERLFFKYQNYPFILFAQINKNALNKLPEIKTAKSVALIDEVGDISAYKDVFVFGNINAEVILIKNQNLTLLSNASFNIKSRGICFVTIERKFIGDADVDLLVLGPKCDFKGTIHANKLVLNSGCAFNGDITVGGK